jgi:hypothetical protein
MSARRLALLIAAIAVAALVSVSVLAPERRSDEPEQVGVSTPGGAPPRAPAPAATSALTGGATPRASAATPSPTAVASSDATPSQTPASEESPAAPQVVPLGLQAAEEYRRQAQFPPWSRPLADEGEDPILRDREVSLISAAGPEGAEPILTVFPDQVGFEAPDPVTLYAFLSIAGSRIPAARITSVITGENLAPLVSLLYRDDGAGGDALAGDYIYSARFEPGPDLVPDLSESFLVRVHAVTPDQQERIATTGFLYSNPHAQLTGRYRDAIVEGSLAIDAEVDVFRPGRFHLEGTLYSQDGRQGIAEAQTAGELPRGRHLLRLTFFGRILSQRGVDGPYLLRFVALSTTTQMPNAKNRLVENAHLTAPYRAAQFSDAPFEDGDLLDAAERLEGDLGGP